MCARGVVRMSQGGYEVHEADGRLMVKQCFDWIAGMEKEHGRISVWFLWPPKRVY